MLADVLTVGADEDDGGPGLYVIGAPGAKVAVVHDGVGDAEAAGGGADVFGHALGGELARVNADYYEVGAVFLFKPVDHRQHVDAVDSAVGPEVEQHQLAAQIGQRERLTSGVDPVEVFREGLGGVGAHDAVCHGAPFVLRAMARTYLVTLQYKPRIIEVPGFQVLLADPIVDTTRVSPFGPRVFVSINLEKKMPVFGTRS